MFGKLFDLDGDGDTNAMEFGLFMSIVNEEDDSNFGFDEDEDEESDSELAEQLAALNAEYSGLCDELTDLNIREPDEPDSDAYYRWELRRDLLEEHMAKVECEIRGLEGI